MRVAQTIVVAIVALGAALSPISGHATGYTHFISHVFHFSIDYPSTWHARFNAKQAYQAFEFGQPGSVTVNYFPISSGLDLQSLTDRVAHAYRDTGFKTGRITYAHGEGRFDAAATLGNLHLRTHLVTLVRRQGLYAINVTAPAAQFRAASTLFDHMLRSFRTA